MQGRSLKRTPKPVHGESPATPFPPPTTPPNSISVLTTNLKFPFSLSLGFRNFKNSLFFEFFLFLDRIFGEDCNTFQVYQARTQEIVSAAVRGFNGPCNFHCNFYLKIFIIICRGREICTTDIIFLIYKHLWIS